MHTVDLAYVGRGLHEEHDSELPWRGSYLVGSARSQ